MRGRRATRRAAQRTQEPQRRTRHSFQVGEARGLRVHGGAGPPPGPGSRDGRPRGRIRRPPAAPPPARVRWTRARSGMAALPSWAQVLHNAGICSGSADAGAGDGAGDAGAGGRTQGGVTARRADARMAGNVERPDKRRSRKGVRAAPSRSAKRASDGCTGGSAPRGREAAAGGPEDGCDAKWIAFIHDRTLHDRPCTTRRVVLCCR